MIRVTLAQANYFILQKQYLTAEKASNITELVADLIGLPAEVPTTPFLAAHARLVKFTPDQLLHGLYQERTFIKSPLMRNRSYVVNTNQYETWAIATARQRKQGFNAELRQWGLETNEVIEHFGQSIVDILAEGPLSIEAISARLPQDSVEEITQTSRGGRVTKTSNVALALRWLVGQGVLGVVNDSADWRIENSIYARLNFLYPDLDLATVPSEAEAQRTLVQAYLAAFGPATEADISSWSGLGKSETARAIQALSSDTTLTLIEGLPGMLLMLREQAEILKAVEPPLAPVISVLPGNDPLATAHRASRARYVIDQRVQRSLLSSSGVAKPTILINGQIVGLWDWQSVNGQDQITWHLLTEIESEFVSLIQAEMQRVATFIHPDSVLQQKAG